jgi:CDP-4-dehydro-6-deoxyglucose reductase, E1
MQNIMEQNNFNWPLINDNISQSDREVLADFCLNGERFTNGPKVKEFENIWSEWLGIKHSVMVNSGASANYISIAMVKELLGEGEIIVPPLGWVSDISSVAQLGMTPVFVDISFNNLAITAENIKQAITPKTKAIVLIHCLGFNGINDEIIKIAKDNNLILIEDCCESHGAMFGDKKIGSIGDISLFSFYFGHHITTIEGGMVCVNNPKLYDLAKLFRSHGMTREASPELQKHYQDTHPELNPLFTFAVAGFNMRSTELNAVLGIEQMKRIDYNISKRVKNLKTWLNYLDPFKFMTGFTTQGNSSFALPLILQLSNVSKLKDVCKILEEEKVEYRLGTAGGGNQALQPYLKKFNYRINDKMHIVDYIHSNSLYIGNHPELTEEQIINLCKKLNNV